MARNKEKQTPHNLSEAARARAQRELMQGQEILDSTALRGRIITAMPLSMAAQKRIAKRFEDVIGQRVRLSCRVDPSQIAGIRVEICGYSYDGTLRGQLIDLHKILTSPDEEE